LPDIISLLASAYNCSADIVEAGSAVHELQAASSATDATAAHVSARRIARPTTLSIMFRPPLRVAAIISAAR